MCIVPQNGQSTKYYIIVRNSFRNQVKVSKSNSRPDVDLDYNFVKNEKQTTVEEDSNKDTPCKVAYQKNN